MIASATGLSTSESRERAFDEIVGRDTERLCALARSILRDEGEAHDAVQETLVKAWRSWDSLSRSDHTSRWLTRVCVNHCISRRRYLRCGSGSVGDSVTFAGDNSTFDGDFVNGQCSGPVTLDGGSGTSGGAGGPVSLTVKAGASLKWAVFIYEAPPGLLGPAP